MVHSSAWRHGDLSWKTPGLVSLAAAAMMVIFASGMTGQAEKW